MSKSALRQKRRAKRRRKANEEQGASPAGRVAGLTGLQRRIGNRAVQRMLKGNDNSSLQRQENESEPMEPAAEAKFPSGAGWVERFPTSEEVRDLDSNFVNDVNEFIAVLEDAGANVEVLATQTPPERAYLMHWAWRIAKEGFDPRRVPYMEGVDVRWWHDDVGASRDAAWSMVHGYEIQDWKSPPPLISPYTEGQALAMQIRWRGELVLYRDKPAEQVITAAPWDGTNPAVIALAEACGLEYAFTVEDSDEVHWVMEGAEAGDVRRNA